MIAFGAPSRCASAASRWPDGGAERLLGTLIEQPDGVSPARLCSANAAFHPGYPALQKPPQEATIDNEIQLISDGDGLAVIGDPTAVERFLRSAGQWSASKELDLRRLKPLLSIGSDVVHPVSEIAANSGHWVKLTEESARLVKEHGLMESKTLGESHLMVGRPGSIKS